MQENSNASESGMVLETLRRRGWCLEDTDQLKAIIVIRTALADDRSKVADSVESELLNSDLRSIGAKSLPEPSLLRNPSSYLHGPKILQISSVRDISKSSVDGISGNSGGRRLLRLCLTDGHSEITAVEYSHIPFLPDNVVPGTKIRLENKVPVHSGIACLYPKALTVLGGVVQSLYEEWQMNQKYSGFSRSSLRQLEDRDTGGPPPFVKLQVGSSSSQKGKGYADSRSSKPIAVVGGAEMRPAGIQHNPSQKEDILDANLKSKLPPERVEDKPSGSGTRPKEGYADSRSSKPIAVVGGAEMRPAGIQHNPNQKEDILDTNLKSKLPPERVEDKPSGSGTRPKEERADDKPSSSGTRPKGVVESVPVQNQAAAQKLLQKLNHPNQGDRHPKGRRHRGKGLQEDSVVLTLEEYEKRKAQAKPSNKDKVPDISHDEHLAWQLQNQLNLEDSQVPTGSREAAAQNIRMSMFTFERDSDGSHQMARGGRSRGRGRGGGRGRGRGRGRYG